MFCPMRRRNMALLRSATYFLFLSYKHFAPNGAKTVSRSPPSVAGHRRAWRVVS